MNIQKSSPFNSPCSLVYSEITENERNNGKCRADKWNPLPSNEEAGAQKAHNCASLRDPLRVLLVETQAPHEGWDTKKVFVVSLEELALVKRSLITLYEDLIKHHVTFRVALFFQQSVMCYSTPFHFEIARTEGQFFQAKTLKVKTEGKARVEEKYEAAHSSTIPGLTARVREEYLADAEGAEEGHSFTFLKGAQMEIMDNSTVSLPSFVNKIDTLIDGQSTGKVGLRPQTIALINQVARAQITPMDATRQFLENFLVQLRERAAASKSITPAKQAVLELYTQRGTEILELARIPETANTPHPLFDSLLDVNMQQENEEDIPKIREIVFKEKFKIVRESQFLESKIQSTIDADLGNFNKDQKHFFRQCLLYMIRNDERLRTALEKLFAISIPAMEKNPKLIREINTELQNDPLFYRNLARDIRALIYNFQRLENCFQAILLRRFRKELRDITGKTLVRKISQVIKNKVAEEKAKEHPNRQLIARYYSLPNSESNISRLENSRIHIVKAFQTPENQRRKALSLDAAEVVAEALEVQKGHFFCSLFASTIPNV